MCTDNLKEARALSFRHVPYSDAEAVIPAALECLMDSIEWRDADSDKFDVAEDDLLDMAENMRDAHVVAIEKLLDLRDVFAKMRAWCDESRPGLDDDELASRLTDEIRKQHDSLTFRYGERV